MKRSGMLCGLAGAVLALTVIGLLPRWAPATDAVDNWSNYTTGLSAPATDIWLITPEADPNDPNDLPFVTRGLYVAVAGNVNVLMKDGTAPVEFYAVAGLYPYRVRRVLEPADPNTAATGLVGVR